jgi:hypothetical protein
MWTRSIRSFAVLAGPSSVVSAHESAHSSATPRSDSPVDTIQLPSQRSAGEVNPFAYEVLIVKHRVNVCVLAPQAST